MPDFLTQDKWLLAGGSILYVLAFLYATTYISFKHTHRQGVFYLLLTAGFALQSFGLYERGLIDQSFPLNNLFEILQVIGWSAVMLEFIVRPAFRLRLLGYFTSGLAGTLCLLALSIPEWDAPITPPTEPGNPWTSFHAALAIFSYGIFSVLATTSLMYLLQHYALQKGQSGSLFSKLPAIRQIDDINKRLLLMGVSILTLSIALGFANYAHNRDGVGIEKLFAAIFVWASYLLVYRYRTRKKLIAAHFAWACLALFIAALLSLWSLHIDTETSPKDITIPHAE